jgi:hypothetical protein
VIHRLDWKEAYRIIPSLYPTIGIFDDVASPEDLDDVLRLEAATNPRVLVDAGELSLVRSEDRIFDEGTTPIMAAFTHTKPSRFSDGTYGVYYAAHDQETAIAETAFHRARFMADAGLMNEIVDMRVYRARVTGTFDDIRSKGPHSKLYDPNPAHWSYPQQYARRIYEQNRADGIAFRSVRRSQGECVAVFHPRCITNCEAIRHLEYRFEDGRFTGALEIQAA